MADFKKYVKFSQTDADRIARAVRSNEAQAQTVAATNQVRRSFRKPSGAGSSLEADFTLDAVLAQTDATGTATITSSPGDPGLVGSTITVKNLPSSAGGYVFFGDAGAYGRATQDVVTGEWWIENLECEPEYSSPQQVTGSTNPAEPFGFYFG